MQLSSMGTQTAVMGALSTASGIMAKANGDMNISDISSMVRNFQKEQMKAEINQEAIGDAMDMGDANEEADDVYN